MNSPTSRTSVSEYFVPVMSFFLILAILSGCNKDAFIEADVRKPQIILDDEYGVYSVKAGNMLTISPTYLNVDDDDIRWLMDGEIVCVGPQWTAQWNELGEFYATIVASNRAGSVSEEIRIDVLKLTPPEISLQLPEDGLRLLPDTDYLIAPDFRHDQLPGFAVEWYINGVLVGEGVSYMFSAHDQGTYRVKISARNEDGISEREFDIEIVDSMPYNVRFPSQSYIRRSTTRYTFVGRNVILEPEVSDFISPSFAWTVDGKEVECDKQKFEFTPLASGSYIISVAVSETSDIAAVPCRMSRNLFRSSSSSARAFVEVVCVDGSETDLRRYPGAGASAYSDKVYEWIPAPGQFINLATMGGAELSHESACVWAQNRLDAGIDVSLGAFGGYIVVGFDHSIVASAGYDFAVVGNAFVGENGAQCSNEPGVVWVMQDVNGNGLPDDEWYELKGSEYDMESTVHGYAVTYYRPEASGMDVRWSDNIGNSGTIDYLAAFHNQPYYYPMWIDSGSYTLSGTSLKARNYFDTAIGVWTTLPYGWGYADNVGSDAITGVQGQQTGFKISNAVFADGTPIDLQYIDFIKVQVAVQAKSGIIGELSTEVLGFIDLNLR